MLADECIYEAHMSSAFNGSSALRRFEHSDAIEIRDGITFDFYTGLPQVYFAHNLCHTIITACYKVTNHVTVIVGVAITAVK